MFFLAENPPKSIMFHYIFIEIIDIGKTCMINILTFCYNKYRTNNCQHKKKIFTVVRSQRKMRNNLQTCMFPRSTPRQCILIHVQIYVRHSYLYHMNLFSPRHVVYNTMTSTHPSRGGSRISHVSQNFMTSSMTQNVMTSFDI